MLVLALLIWVGVSFGVPNYLSDCVDRAVPIGEFIHRAESYTGKAYTVYLKKREETGECLYTVKGKKGTAIVNAETGEVVKFFKRH